MKILSLNVRVWTRDLKKSNPIYWRKRLEGMVTLIINKAPDVICLQEAFFPFTRIFLKALKKKHYQYYRVGFSFSNPILVKSWVKPYAHKSWFTIHLHGVTFSKVLHQNQAGASCQDTFEIINVHSHWNKRVISKNLRQISRRKKNNIPIIACGDFNNTLGSIMGLIVTRGIEFYSIREMCWVEPKGTFAKMDESEPKMEIDHFLYFPAPLEVPCYLFPKNYNRPDRLWRTRSSGLTIISDHYPITVNLW